MPNFSSLARLEVPEKFVWGGGGGGLQSHFHVKPNRCVVLCWGWGFDNMADSIKPQQKCEFSNNVIAAITYTATQSYSPNILGINTQILQPKRGQNCSA